MVDGYVVEWWVDDDGVLYVSIDVGLVCVFVWVVECWYLCYVVVEVLVYLCDVLFLVIEEVAG